MGDRRDLGAQAGVAVRDLWNAWRRWPRACESRARSGQPVGGTDPPMRFESARDRPGGLEIARGKPERDRADPAARSRQRLCRGWTSPRATTTARRRRIWPTARSRMRPKSPRKPWPWPPQAQANPLPDPRATERRGHVGYYLIDDGITTLQRELGCRLPWGTRLRQHGARNPAGMVPRVDRADHDRGDSSGRSAAGRI